MSDHAYDEGYRAGMQKMREVGQSKIEVQRNEIARLTQKLEALTKVGPRAKTAQVLGELVEVRSGGTQDEVVDIPSLPIADCG